MHISDIFNAKSKSELAASLNTVIKSNEEKTVKNLTANMINQIIANNLIPLKKSKSTILLITHF